MTIREYTSDDFTVLHECISQLQAYEQSKEPKWKKTPKVAKQYAQLLCHETSNKGGKILFAQDSQSLQGMICFWKENTDDMTEKNIPFLFISDIFVFPSFRNSGVGKFLFSQAEEFAKSHNLSSLKINALASNTIANQAYLSWGFRTYEIAYRKDIS